MCFNISLILDLLPCNQNYYIFVVWRLKTVEYVNYHIISITGAVTRLTWRVPLVERELLTIPEQMRSLPVFSGVRVTRSLLIYICFVDRWLSFCTFSFGHYVVCSSSIYGFCLPLWYLQTLLVWKHLVLFNYCRIRRDSLNIFYLLKCAKRRDNHVLQVHGQF